MNAEDEVVVEVTVDHPEFQGSIARLQAAARQAVHFAQRTEGLIEVTIVTDDKIHQLNREALNHDYPTDVISFGYEDDGDSIEGEVIVSWDTARRVAAELNADAHDELVLYVVHGTLHVCGYDDIEPQDRELMREAEKSVLEKLKSA